MKVALILWLFAIATIFVLAAMLLTAEAHRGFWYVIA